MEAGRLYPFIHDTSYPVKWKTHSNVPYENKSSMIQKSIPMIISHQRQFQSTQTLVPFQSHACQRMDQQRSQSQRNNATNLQHVELQRTVPTGRFLLVTHFSHSGSRTRCREPTDPKSLHGPRQVIGFQKECHQDPERR